MFEKLKAWTVREVEPHMVMPTGFRYAWTDQRCHKDFAVPVGLHWVVRGARWLWAMTYPRRPDACARLCDEIRMQDPRDGHACVTKALRVLEKYNRADCFEGGEMDAKRAYRALFRGVYQTEPPHETPLGA